jgi:hypothetical protein
MPTVKTFAGAHSLATGVTLLVIAFSSIGFTRAYAAVLIVNNSADTGPGSLRQAVADAPDGSLITFDPSLSGATIYLSSQLTIDKSLKIDGSALAAKITISGDTDNNGAANVRVFATSSVDVVILDSLIIAKGDGYADLGGGISNSGILSLVNTTVRDSSAAGGGGIYNSGTGILNVSKCALSGNDALGGGGIYNEGTLSVTSSTLSANTARWGGAIWNDTVLTVTNSTIAGNSANQDGGGIYQVLPGAYANVYNTSIVFNVADADADQLGGVAGGVYASGTFNMRNDLIAGNTVGGLPVYDDCAGTLKSYGRDLIGAPYQSSSGSCQVVSVVGTWANLNNLNLLGSLQNNGGPTQTVALLPGSNAIDGADPIFGCTDVNGAVIGKDQRGVVRPQGVRCDVGAYERAPDTDGDGLADELDNCKQVANPTQLDADSDGYGNICDADLNNSGTVTTADFGLLRSVLGQPASFSPTAAVADMNGSGTVTTADFGLLRARLGTGPGPSGLACAGTIPCP